MGGQIGRPEALMKKGGLTPPHVTSQQHSSCHPTDLPWTHGCSKACQVSLIVAAHSENQPDWTSQWDVKILVPHAAICSWPEVPAPPGRQVKEIDFGPDRSFASSGPAANG
jgi:hypothetical protein